MMKLNIVALLAWLQVALVSAQFGRDCSSTRACMPHQICYYGYCSCERGFVRNEEYCFPVKKYGESCFFDVQCVDHRMTCREDNSSTPVVKTCLCDRFHAWSEELQECVQALNTTDILSTLKVANSLAHIESEGQTVFAWIVASGLTVAAVLTFIAVLLIVYGCCLYECYDRCTGDYTDIENKRCSGECRHYR